MDLNQKYPSVDDMEAAARRRIPRFAFEYLYSGIGREAGLARNRSALDAVTFRPRYLLDRPVGAPDVSTTLLGQRFARPFGITPFGLSGLMWPRAAEIAARAAARADIPIVLSSYATTRMEVIREIAGENAWYQHYPVNRPEVQTRMLREIREAGYETLVVTVDIPTETRRDRDLRVGLSVPPKINLRTILDAGARPRWAWATMWAGQPQFVNLLPHLDAGRSLKDKAAALVGLMDGAISVDSLRQIRDQWPGKLVIKGIMHPEDARTALSIGADGVWVSNHGGRQLDAALASVELLPEIRAAIGADVPLMVDSGPRTGLDIARMLARGADFVFLGRAFIYGIAALGERGADHVCHVLATELRTSMGQIGCSHIAQLEHHLD